MREAQRDFEEVLVAIFDMEQNFKCNIIGRSQGSNIDFRQTKIIQTA